MGGLSELKPAVPAICFLTRQERIDEQTSEIQEAAHRSGQGAWKIAQQPAAANQAQ